MLLVERNQVTAFPHYAQRLTISMSYYPPLSARKKLTSYPPCPGCVPCICIASSSRTCCTRWLWRHCTRRRQRAEQATRRRQRRQRQCWSQRLQVNRSAQTLNKRVVAAGGSRQQGSLLPLMKCCGAGRACMRQQHCGTHPVPKEDHDIFATK